MIHQNYDGHPDDNRSNRVVTGAVLRELQDEGGESVRQDKRDLQPLTIPFSIGYNAAIFRHLTTNI